MRSVMMENYAAFLSESRDDLRATRDATAKYAELEAVAKRDAIDEANDAALWMGRIQAVVAVAGAATAVAGLPTQVQHGAQGPQSVADKLGDNATGVGEKLDEAIAKRDAGLQSVTDRRESGELNGRQAKKARRAIEGELDQTVLIDRKNPTVTDVTVGELRGQKDFADRLAANSGDLQTTLMESEVPAPRKKSLIGAKADQVRERLQESLGKGLEEDERHGRELAGEHDEMKGRAMAMHAKSVAELAAIARDMRELAAVGRKS